MEEIKMTLEEYQTYKAYEDLRVLLKMSNEEEGTNLTLDNFIKIEVEDNKLFLINENSMFTEAEKQDVTEIAKELVKDMYVKELVSGLIKECEIDE